MVRVRVRVGVWAGDALGTVVVGRLDSLLVDGPVANLGVGHEDGLTVAQHLRVRVRVRVRVRARVRVRVRVRVTLPTHEELSALMMSACIPCKPILGVIAGECTAVERLRGAGG